VDVKTKPNCHTAEHTKLLGFTIAAQTAAEPSAPVTLAGVSRNPMFTQSDLSSVPAVSSEFDHFRQHQQFPEGSVAFGSPSNLSVLPVGRALNF
jgi:hypothetical protein